MDRLPNTKRDKQMDRLTDRQRNRQTDKDLTDKETDKWIN